MGRRRAPVSPRNGAGLSPRDRSWRLSCFGIDVFPLRIGDGIVHGDYWASHCSFHMARQGRSHPAPSSAHKSKNLCERLLPRTRRVYETIPKLPRAALLPWTIFRVCDLLCSRVSLRYERVGDAGRPDTLSKSGGHRLLVYLFRDENSRDTFAYSTDVTGRNIPRASTYTQWSFVAAEKIQGLPDFEAVTRHLRQQGFHIFRRSAP